MEAAERALLETVVECFRGLDHRLETLDRKIDALAHFLHHQGAQIMTTLDDLTAAVAAETTVTDSVLTFIQGLEAQLLAAAPGNTAVEALVTTMKANAARLSAAVVANTPAAPPAVPAPVVAPATP
jgi:hypothetical protein